MPSDVLPYQTISLNSQYASGTTSQFRFPLPDNLIEIPVKKKVKIGVLKATFIGAYTNVNVLNNQLVITETDIVNGGDLTFVVSLVVGTVVSTAALVTALNTALNAASAASGYNLTYACTQASNIITFVVTTPDFGVTLEVNDSRFTAIQLLGLEPPDNGTPAFIDGDDYVAPFVVNISNYFGPQEIHIRCSDMISRCYESRAGSVTSILAICQNNVTVEDQNMTFATPIPNILMETSYNMTSLTFQITNPQGEELVGLAGPVTMLLGCYHYDSD